MIGRVLPSIMARNSAKGMQTDMAKSVVDSAMSDMSGDLKGVGEPTSIDTSDSSSGYADHPAKMNY